MTRKKILTKDDICNWLLATYWKEKQTFFEGQRRFERGTGSITCDEHWFSIHDKNMGGMCKYEDIEILESRNADDFIEGEMLHCGDFWVKGW